MDVEHLRFPIGRYNPPKLISDNQLNEWISEIEAFPVQLKEAASSLSETALNTPFRPGGWTIKQVIHHVADSHMNSYIRFKLAVTEENPTIKPYFEDRWAEFDEAKNADITISLNLLEALHKRWCLFLRAMDSSDWEKTYYHPENKEVIELKEVAGLYAWHGKHHLSHVLLLKD